MEKDLKICANCRKISLLSNFYKDKRALDSLDSYCKKCRKKIVKKWVKDNPEKAKKMWFKSNKKWSKNHPEQANKIKRNWARNNPEKVAKTNKNWEINNPDKAAKIQAKSNKNWRKNNPEKESMNSANRRARKQRVTPKWVDMVQIYKIYAECHQISKVTGILHHVDHIIPLRGKNVTGLHVPWNLQIIPAIENLKKSNKVRRPS